MIEPQLYAIIECDNNIICVPCIIQYNMTNGMEMFALLLADESSLVNAIILSIVNVQAIDKLGYKRSSLDKWNQYVNLDERHYISAALSNAYVADDYLFNMKLADSVRASNGKHIELSVLRYLRKIKAQTNNTREALNAMYITVQEICNSMQITFMHNILNFVRQLIVSLETDDGAITLESIDDAIMSIENEGNVTFSTPKVESEFTTEDEDFLANLFNDLDGDNE